MRQIGAREGTESFVSISAAVFELSRKSGRGGAESAPPPLLRGAGERKTVYLRRPDDFAMKYIGMEQKESKYGANRYVSLYS